MSEYIMLYDYNDQRKYYSHLAYTLGTTAKVATQISNNPELMNTLLLLGSDKIEHDVTVDKAIELLRDDVAGLGNKKATVLVNSYVETPYKPDNSEVRNAILAKMGKYSQDSPEMRWLMTAPKYKKSPIDILSKELGDPTFSSIWEVYQEERIPFDVAYKAYWLFSPDTQEEKVAVSDVFKAYDKLAEVERNFNQPFLKDDNIQFDKDALKKTKVLKKTSLGWVRSNTEESIKSVYRTLVDNKIPNTEVDKRLYLSFLEEGLEGDQAEAACRIMNNRITFLTGISGSGKTFMLNKVLERLVEDAQIETEDEENEENSPLYFKIFMTAIAGRAVKNFQNNTPDVEVRGSTIAGVKYVKALRNDLKSSQVVIIDEISMVDMNSLALVLNNSAHAQKIIMIGDVAQLPAIQLDFYSKASKDDVIVPVMLTKPKRQTVESGILEDGTAIRNGKMPQFNKPDSQLKPFINIAQVVNDNVNADAFLVGTNATATQINDILVNKLLFEHQENNERALVMGKMYATGTKFLVTKNNADSGLMNGEIITLNVEDGIKTFINEFDQTLNYFDEEKCKLKPGFAMTIHKSQGSTIGNVVTILDSEMMATRPLLYTAMTRAKKNHVLYEAKEGILERAINRGVEFQDYDYRIAMK